MDMQVLTQMVLKIDGQNSDLNETLVPQIGVSSVNDWPGLVESNQWFQISGHHALLSDPHMMEHRSILLTTNGPSGRFSYKCFVSINVLSKIKNGLVPYAHEAT